jgi:hypothetical protein
VYTLEPVPVWAVNSVYGEEACAVNRKKEEKKMDEKNENARLGFGDDMISPVMPVPVDHIAADHKKFKEMRAGVEQEETYNEGSPRMKRVREKEAAAWEAEREAVEEIDAFNEAWDDAPKYGEQDEDGLSQHEPGAKLDHGKVDVYRHFIAMFPDAMECIARVSEYGENKYSYMGWAKVSEGQRRYTAALNRHLLDEARGEVYDIDPEKGSDLPHAAQAAWNAMARLQLMIVQGDIEIKRGRELNSSN